MANDHYWSKNAQDRSLIKEAPLLKKNRATFKETYQVFIRATFPFLHKKINLVIKNLIHGNKPRSTENYGPLKKKKIIRSNDTQRFIEIYRKNVLTFIAIARANEIKPILMTQANRYTLSTSKWVKNFTIKEIAEKNIKMSYEQWVSFYKKINQTTRQIALKENILLLDMDKKFTKEDPSLIYDGIHYTSKGSKMAATIIAKDLAQGLLDY